MKIRQGFVSNSSSSSFIIGKSHLTDEQLEKIKNHMELSKDMGMWDDLASKFDEWCVEDTGDYVKMSTSMDNFDMYEFLEKIGVDVSKLESWHS